MPVVGISVKQLVELVGGSHTTGELLALCREIGCDIDEVTTLGRIKCINCDFVIEIGGDRKPPRCEACSHSFDHENGSGYRHLPDQDVLKIDLLANRPDNFDAAGLARTLRGYLGIETGLAQYRAYPPKLTVKVDKAMNQPGCFRPFIACAVLKGVKLDQDSLKNLMKLQENLHWALGRDRKHASIGVYDLAKIAGPLRYLPGEKSRTFIPLGDREERRLDRISEDTPKGKAYAHLLKGFSHYPLLVDANGRILSMPPVINSEDTKVTVESTDLLIDVTGTLNSPTEKALHIVVSSLAETNPNASIEQVTIEIEGEERRYPDFNNATVSLDPDYCRKLIGVDLDDQAIIAALEKMRFSAKRGSGKYLEVSSPSYRNDILHPCDLIEDLAIAYGYKNIATKPITTATIGAALPCRSRIEACERVMTGLGFLEITTIVLTSEERSFGKLGLPIDQARVILDNPISIEQTMIRTELMSGLLETLALNLDNELPQRIFEIGQVSLLDPEMETGATEHYHIAAAIIATKVGFSDIKAVALSLLHHLGIRATFAPFESPVYLKGRSATIIAETDREKTAIGQIGEVNPAILERYGLTNPVALFELTRVSTIR